jgi:anti-anti-sigma regulatory factor
MDITVSQEQGRISITIIKVVGQLDGQSYESLISKAREVIEGGSRNLLIDMSELSYISSAGLVSLHTISLMARGESLPDLEQGWSALKSMDRSRDGGLQKNIKLLNPRPEVVSVLDMVGFSAFFEVFTDKQKAIDSF